MLKSLILMALFISPDKYWLYCRNIHPHFNKWTSTFFFMVKRFKWDINLSLFTFFTDPATASAFPMDYLEKVKEVHSIGGYGSQGYKYDWKLEEAEKNILRTHTTAVSARMLYKLAQEVPFLALFFFYYLCLLT